MKIATFNVNGIRARLPRVIDWIDECSPDVALLQEIKCQDGVFPAAEFEDKGYNAAVHGQKSFNGVAILSKFPIEDVIRGLPGADDDQARWIEATVIDKSAVRVCCLYLPNGNPAPGPKYDYKLRWMKTLENRAKTLIETEEPTLLAGDFNVIPERRDAHSPEKWEDDALFLHETRTAWRKIVNLGFADAFRLKCDAPLNYTFWDFQGGAWNRNDGIRIDHFLLNSQCADLLENCQIDKHVRGEEKPSDHVPVWVKLDA